MAEIAEMHLKPVSRMITFASVDPNWIMLLNTVLVFALNQERKTMFQTGSQMSMIDAATCPAVTRNYSYTHGHN